MTNIDAKTVLEKHRGTPQSMAFARSLGRGVHRTAIELWDALEQTLARAERAEAWVELLSAMVGGDGERIERVTEDDEVVAKNSSFHMERMDEDHIWFQVDGIAFDLYAVRSGLFRRRLVWRPQMHGEWAALAAGEVKP